MRRTVFIIAVCGLMSACAFSTDATSSYSDNGNAHTSEPCSAEAARSAALAEQEAKANCLGVDPYSEAYEATAALVDSERELAETRSRMYWLGFRRDKAADAIGKTERLLMESSEEQTRSELNQRLVELQDKHATLTDELDRLSERARAQQDLVQTIVVAAGDK